MYAFQHTEFIELFQEFKNTFVDTLEGQAHLQVYARTRQTGRENFQAIQATIEAKEIRQASDLADTAITQQILQKLLPHTMSANNQERGVWTHIAPAITGDIQTWYEASGFEGDWNEVAFMIFSFAQACVQVPENLAQICQDFSASPSSKGFQAGMLSPILNALNPDKFHRNYSALKY